MDLKCVMARSEDYTNLKDVLGCLVAPFNSIVLPPIDRNI